MWLAPLIHKVFGRAVAKLPESPLEELLVVLEGG